MTSTFQVSDLIVILVYFLSMILLGLYYARKIKDSDSFVVADRSLTMPIMIGTTVATAMGAGAALGNVEMARSMGIAALLVIATWDIGWIALICCSKQLRNSEASTLPEFLEMRYGKTTRLLAGLVTITFLLNATAAQTAAVGRIMQSIGLLNFTWGVIIGGIIIILYTVFGGLYAVAVSDTVQAVMLVIGVIIAIPWALFSEAGGIGHVFANTDPALLNPFNVAPGLLIGLLISYALTAGSHPAYVQRILAAVDTHTAFWGSIWSNALNFVLSVPIVLSAFTIPFVFPEMTSGELLIPTTIVRAFPPVMTGFVMAALIALIMSTADSFLLLLSTTIANDIYGHFVPNATSQYKLKLSRYMVVILEFIAIAMALTGGGVLALFNTGAAAYGAGMAIPLFLACFWKRAKSYAINIGMIVGCFFTVFWNLVYQKSTGINGVIMGAALCLVCSMGLSLVGGAREEEQQPAAK